MRIRGIASARAAKKARSAPALGMIALAGFIALILPANTALAKTLTVDQAIDEALRANPDFLAARQRLSAAKARLVKAHYWNPFNPVVQAGAERWRSRETGGVAEPTINASIEVEVAGQRGRRIQEAEENLAEARALAADARRSLIAQVKNSFYRALYLKRRVELFQKIEGFNRRLRDASQTRFSTGEGTKLEANLEGIRYDQSRRDTLVGQRDYRDGLREFRRVIGSEADAPVEPDGSLEVRPLEINVSGLLETAFANRPDLKASNFEIKRVEAEAALTKRLIVPNPIISGAYSREPAGPGSNFQIAGGSIGISIPLFDRKQAELTALAGDRRRASYNRRAALLNIATEVRDAADGYEAAAQSLRIYESDMAARVEQNFGFIEASYRAGKISLLQLVVVQNDLVRAELSYLDALWEYRAARTGLEFAIGADLDKAVRP